jgi:hypothetical protein
MPLINSRHISNRPLISGGVDSCGVVMTVREEYIPENNLVVLLLLLITTCLLYYFWWLVRISKVFQDNAVSNVLLTIFTCGLWGMFINLRYLQKSEELNGRDMKWYMVFFLPIAVLIIQNNINERFFPGR